MVGSLTLGVVLGVTLLLTVILPRMGVGPAQRIVEIGTLLGRGFDAQTPTAVALGSSVFVEGIDARVVERAAPGWDVVNLALNGCEIGEQRLIVPAALDAGADAVILPVRAATFATPPDPEPDKLYAYVLSGMVDAVDPASLPFSPPALGMLQSSDLDAKLHFRRAPIEATNAAVRARMRAAVRAADPADFDAPYELSGTITGDRLSRHAGVVRGTIAERTAELPQTPEHELLLAVRAVRDAGAVPVLVIVPHHPAVLADDGAAIGLVRELTARVAASGEAIVIDAVDLVGAEGFADAVHLNESGRERLSALIGEALASLPAGNAN